MSWGCRGPIDFRFGNRLHNVCRWNCRSHCGKYKIANKYTSFWRREVQPALKSSKLFERGDAMAREIFAFLSIGSTYTYLTALRLRSVLSAADAKMVFRPFSVRTIMLDMDNVPFPPSKPEKQVYMWRDIERRAEKYDLPALKMPVAYPLRQFDMANWAGVVANNEGWYLDYLEATYRLWFVEGIAAGSEENLTQICVVLGRDYDALVELATAPETAHEYYENTNEARALGVFGAPSFVVGNELFWGDDRLEDAVAHYAASEG